LSDLWYRNVTERVRDESFEEICSTLDALDVPFLAPRGVLLTLLKCEKCGASDISGKSPEGGWKPCAAHAKAARANDIERELLNMQKRDYELKSLLP
jgi:hypothetical protein